MIAVQFRKSIARYLALRALGRRVPRLYTGPLSMISLRELPDPQLPTPRWVRVSPTLSGICGSDLATVCAKGSPYFSPLTSTPFILGHELVGRITELGQEGSGFALGDRVVVQPALGCSVRGIDPPCTACAAGQVALCRNVTRGDIASGIQTGYCRDTGGAWSEALVAHQSQLYLVPDAVDDTAAVLTEPLACAIHAVLRANGVMQTAENVNPKSASSPQSSVLSPRTTVLSPLLVMGCGTIGLLVISAMRALGISSKIIAVAKYPHQAEFARKFGADEVIGYERSVNARYALLAEACGAELHQPEIGKPTVLGGASVAFDCVASSASIDDCCRFTTAGGQVVLVGMPAIPKGIDWTGIWYKELAVRAAYAYGVETHNGKKRATFELALDMLARCGPDLATLVGQPFALQNYRQAIQSALHTGATGSVKTVFRIGPAV